ncbi:hypothetical protein AD952_02165 [Acetobacter cerevisiae]|uniref:DUF2125 domain-containing protein n=1 Tax=Acetobacter cerevisiae TaxID=178900 RepID=A0A149UY61_9PROT|nr:DUF2125 domain-containing protein [Acetobacter cerevisiae]KXV72920.1 hypothetical protein AD952_02165 [Acetobacter cerevisiae]
MRKSLGLLACAGASVLALDSLLWWGGVQFLEHRLASASASGVAQSVGCPVVFQHKQRGGWPFRAQVSLEGVQIMCGASAGQGGVSYAVRHAVLDLAPWHPLTVQGTLDGGQVLAVQAEKAPAGSQKPGYLLLKTDGAPVRISLPSRAAEAGTLLFRTDFLHLVPQRGVAEAHPVTARGVSGKLVWNSHADVQASALALSFAAQRAVVAPWADSVDDVQGAVSLPGPMARLVALWSPDDTASNDPPASDAGNLGGGESPDGGMGSTSKDQLASSDHGATDAGSPSVLPSSPSGASPGYAEILVQHVGGRWRRLGISWSGRLVMATGGTPLGETWLTLSNWRPFLARLQQDKTLSPAQTVLLSKLTDQLEQRTGGREGPLSVPLQVRDGAVQLGGVPLLSVLATLHSVSLSGASAP